MLVSPETVCTGRRQCEDLRALSLFKSETVQAPVPFKLKQAISLRATRRLLNPSTRVWTETLEKHREERFSKSILAFC